MGNLDYKRFSRRHRPHFNPPDATLFLTFRLAGSIPQPVIREYRSKMQWLASQLKRVQLLSDNNPTKELIEWRGRVKDLNRDWFIKTEDILHRAKHGPTWMADPSVADKVAENLHRLDGSAYRLDAYSILSNHVHTVFRPFLSAADLSGIVTLEDCDPLREHPGLSRIMHSIKGRSARECNLLLGRSGAFWEHESFDHVIRRGKFDKTIRYVLNNPIKSGLVDHWEDWQWNYCRKELVERFDEEGREVGRKARSWSREEGEKLK